MQVGGCNGSGQAVVQKAGRLGGRMWFLCRGLLATDTCLQAFMPVRRASKTHTQSCPTAQRGNSAVHNLPHAVHVSQPLTRVERGPALKMVQPLPSGGLDSPGMGGATWNVM